MDLTVNQIIAVVISCSIILKIFILLLLPNSYYKKIMRIYDNSSVLNSMYYVYITIGFIIFISIYYNSDLSLADMLATGFAFMIVYVAGIIKLMGPELLSSMQKYNNFIDLYKSIWLYLLLWLFISVLTLKEIF